MGACPVSHSTFEEVTREEPGRQILLDRTLDLMLITALRAWFTRPGAQVPAWYRAHSDPVVGPVLRLLHASPAHPWTLPTLAASTGVSRANLARRFTALVGQPPMTCLRRRRLSLAADLLREPDTTLASGGRPCWLRQRLRSQCRLQESTRCQPERIPHPSGARGGLRPDRPTEIHPPRFPSRIPIEQEAVPGVAVARVHETGGRLTQ